MTVENEVSMTTIDSNDYDEQEWTIGPSSAVTTDVPKDDSHAMEGQHNNTAGTLASDSRKEEFTTVSYYDVMTTTDVEVTSTMRSVDESNMTTVLRHLKTDPPNEEETTTTTQSTNTESTLIIGTLSTIDIPLNETSTANPTITRDAKRTTTEGRKAMTTREKPVGREEVDDVPETTSTDPSFILTTLVESEEHESTAEISFNSSTDETEVETTTLRDRTTPGSAPTESRRVTSRSSTRSHLENVTTTRTTFVSNKTVTVATTDPSTSEDDCPSTFCLNGGSCVWTPDGWQVRIRENITQTAH